LIEQAARIVAQIDDDAAQMAAGLGADLMDRVLQQRVSGVR